jgi:hypothetical protein
MRLSIPWIALGNVLRSPQDPVDQRIRRFFIEVCKELTKMTYWTLRMLQNRLSFKMLTVFA